MFHFPWPKFFFQPSLAWKTKGSPDQHRGKRTNECDESCKVLQAKLWAWRLFMCSDCIHLPKVCGLCSEPSLPIWVEAFVLELAKWYSAGGGGNEGRLLGEKDLEVTKIKKKHQEVKKQHHNDSLPRQGSGLMEGCTYTDWLLNILIFIMIVLFMWSYKEEEPSFVLVPINECSLWYEVC